METKFLLACCVLSFVFGAYTAVLINKNRGCTVEIKNGHVTHVFIGRAD